MSEWPGLLEMVSGKTSTDTKKGKYLETASDFCRYLYMQIMVDEEIGYCYFLPHKVTDKMRKHIMAYSRMAVKKEDVLLVDYIDEDQEGTDGLAFCEDRIIYWRNEGESVIQIPYKEIKSVDYNKEHVTLKVNDEKIELDLGEDYDDFEIYENMYVFIMHLLDYEEGSHYTKEDVERYDEYISSIAAG